ncbi:MAG: bifunctional phosphopantothenoylcysteine decarboxylase/phosphopantothenate--cysteine ligase CoaBC [Deltaproteobacteria bacterium]|jgi:phosphopantothenoylcysteine decarboxylase/phosphopantothenate--cysteine ligase|nr:bifunctional phosphopantothenoylcysteine decarboxylase/phosphopantothenate--cysteine ligase CoaBC [Deltaproteobacteria bacterium]
MAAGFPPDDAGRGPGVPPEGPPRVPSSVLETLSGRRIVLVVTGGVAAYKAAALARLLAKSGALVRTAMTEAGTRFVTPLTFEAVTGGECRVSMWDRDRFDIAHVSWAGWAELALVAPATADFLARAAAGLAGDFASSVILASRAPVVFCPAMNTGMLEHPATRANLAILVARAGATVMGSPEGPLACGTSGAGRMAEPRDIALQAARVLCRGALDGKRALVTSGATVEPWDDVRVITNRSSGRMGAEIARACWVMGADVTLLSGPSAEDAGIASGDSFRQERVTDCRDLLARVGAEAGAADLLVMNAAPADFRPSSAVAGKIRKAGGVPELALVPNPDVLRSVGGLKKPGSVWVGFAAEPEDGAMASAMSKLRSKGLDLIAVNATSAFGGEVTGITLLDAGGGTALSVPDGSPKFAAAWLVVKAAAERLGKPGRPEEAP